MQGVMYYVFCFKQKVHTLISSKVSLSSQGEESACRKRKRDVQGQLGTAGIWLPAGWGMDCGQINSPLWEAYEPPQRVSEILRGETL